MPTVHTSPLLDAYAAHPLWLFVLPSIGLLLLFVVLSTTGRLVRGVLFSAPAFEHVPFGIDGALGWLTHLVVFTSWSFLRHVWPAIVPPIFELAPLLLVLVLSGRRALELVRMRLNATFAGFVLVTLAVTYHFFFSLEYASTDPAIIALYIERARRFGEFALFVSPDNPALPMYPFGASAVGWALANPLLTSLQVAHVWPAVSSTLVVWAAFDVCATRVTTARSRLGLWLFALLARVGLFAFELRPGAYSFEGASKQQLGSFLVAALFLVWALPSARTARGRVIALALALVAAAVPGLVNPVSAYVSAVACLGVLALGSGGSGWRSRIVSMLAALAVTSAGVLQDPFVASRARVVCGLFADVPACSRPPEMSAAEPPITTPWRALLGRVAQSPVELLWPTTSPFLHPVAQTQWLLIVCCGLIAYAVIVRPRPRKIARALLACALFSSALMLLGRAEVYLFARALPRTLEGMLRVYPDLVFLNLWHVIAVLGALAAFVACVRAHRFAAVLPFVFLSIATFNTWRVLLARGERSLGAVLTSGADHARVVHEASGRLFVHDIVMHQAEPVHIGPEPWSFAGYRTFTLELLTDTTLRFGFSGGLGWPPDAQPYSEHFRRVCASDCAYLAGHGITSFVVLGSEDTMCGRSARAWADGSPCFSAPEPLSTPGAAVYRLKKP